VVAATPGDTSSRVAGGSPGPNQLYQLALQQLQRGSYATARAGFDDLLRQYPTSDLAPDAQVRIAESFEAEGQGPQADSVYLLVVEKYPRAPKAANALYKHALLLKRAGRDADAKAAFERVVREYPRSDEAVLARGQLGR
jgi:tol-pal system protein YbgF